MNYMTISNTKLNYQFHMKLFSILLLLLVSCAAKAQSDTTQKVVQGRRNSPEQQAKPYVILISVDGFRHDYVEKHNTTFLRELGKQGVRAKYMRPSYPTLTFPNHYTLVTGLFPSHHGLVGNNIYDPATNDNYSMSKVDKVRNKKWYGGTPLWVLAEQQQMLSASLFWVGSEAPISDVRPTYYYNYNEEIPIDKRIKIIVDWLQLPADRRPHLINFYMPELDHDGHNYGPDPAATGQTARWIDTAIHRLTQAVQATGLDVNFVFVSDHGMTKVRTDQWIKTPVADTSKVAVASGGEILQWHVKDKSKVDSIYRAQREQAKNYKVYLKTNMPKRLHYGAGDDRFNRIGDIIMVPDWPLVFGSRKPKPGAHGFDQYTVKDMRAIFYAWGPAFKKGKTIGNISNVDVYPVVTSVLGLQYAEKIDGKEKVARKILR